MITIYKYPLIIDDRQIIQMPSDAVLLCVQVQRGIPCLWARVDEDNAAESRVILTRGTGHAAAGVGDYVGTYQIEGGQLVFHVFDGGVVLL